MTLYELLVKYQDEKENAISTVMALYPDQKKNESGFLMVYEKLLTLTPIKDSDNTQIKVDWVKDEFEDESDEYLGVSGVQPDNDTTWSLSLAPWEEWLGMDIYTNNWTYAWAIDLEIIAACLWEMTWHGFTQEVIQVERDELSRRIEELESGKAKTVSWEELKASLESLLIED